MWYHFYFFTLNEKLRIYCIQQSWALLAIVAIMWLYKLSRFQLWNAFLAIVTCTYKSFVKNDTDKLVVFQIFGRDSTWPQGRGPIYIVQFLFTLSSSYLHRPVHNYIVQFLIYIVQFLFTLSRSYLHCPDLIYIIQFLFTFSSSYLHGSVHIYITVHSYLHCPGLIYIVQFLFTLSSSYLHWPVPCLIYIVQVLFTLSSSY